MQVGDTVPAATGGADEQGHVSFDAFARQERKPLLAFAWSLLGSHAEAEEVVQEAFAAAWRSWDKVGQYDKPGAWARRVVAHRATDRRRRQGHERDAVLRMASQRDGLVAVTDPIGSLNPDNEFWAAVRALPERQAQAVALHYLEDLAISDIAEVLDCAAGTVKAHLHRGRTSLARALGLLGTDVTSPEEEA